MPRTEVVCELLNKPYLLRRSKELHIGNSLLNLFSYFVEAGMVVGLAERPVYADEIVDALLLTAVLPVAAHGEGMTKSYHKQSNKSRDKNL